jgi:hypothetical protein
MNLIENHVTTQGHRLFVIMLAIMLVATCFLLNLVTLPALAQVPPTAITEQVPPTPPTPPPAPVRVWPSPPNPGGTAPCDANVGIQICNGLSQTFDQMFGLTNRDGSIDANAAPWCNPQWTNQIGQAINQGACQYCCVADVGPLSPEEQQRQAEYASAYAPAPDAGPGGLVFQVNCGNGTYYYSVGRVADIPTLTMGRTSSPWSKNTLNYVVLSGSDAFKAAVDDVLAKASALTGLQFVKGTLTGIGGVDPDITFSEINNENGVTETSYGEIVPGAMRQDIFGITRVLIMTHANYLPGVYNSGYAILLHEVGHILGLKHPGNYGVAACEEPYLDSELDNNRNTVMSYNMIVNNDGTITCHVSDYMALDRLALGAIYGRTNGAP